MEIAAVVFILIMLAIAYFAFRILKRTLKMAMRAVVVLVILAIAVVGGLAIWNLDAISGKSPSASSKSR